VFGHGGQVERGVFESQVELYMRQVFRDVRSEGGTLLDSEGQGWLGVSQDDMIGVGVACDVKGVCLVRI
jgi:hypothetical protein